MLKRPLVDGRYVRSVLRRHKVDLPLPRQVKATTNGTFYVKHVGGGDVILYDEQGRNVIHLVGKDVFARIGGGSKLSEAGPSGQLEIHNQHGQKTIELDGDSGDIVLHNADFAEDFDIAVAEAVEPGTGDGAGRYGGALPQ